MKKKDKSEKLYDKNGYWYINNYNSTGSQWLIKALHKLDLPQNYRFGSFSANFGWYERDAYIEESDKSPEYYLGDKYADNLGEKRIEPKDKLHYLEGNRDFTSIKLEDINNGRLDVLLDFRGALWYSIYKRKDENELILYLRKSIELINDNGGILLDIYKGTAWKNSAFQIKCATKKIKKRNIKYFGEYSTFQLIEKALGKQITDKYIEKMNIDIHDSEYPLASKMDVGYINASAIQKVIEYIERNRKKVRKNIRMLRIKHNICEKAVTVIQLVIQLVIRFSIAVIIIFVIASILSDKIMPQLKILIKIIMQQFNIWFNKIIQLLH